MIQYANFGHYSTPGWCPNVQLYIKYKTQHPSFGQPSETISLLFLRNSLVFSILPQNKKILPPQLNKKARQFSRAFFVYHPLPLHHRQKKYPIVRIYTLDNRIISLTNSCHIKRSNAFTSCRPILSDSTCLLP